MSAGLGNLSGVFQMAVQTLLPIWMPRQIMSLRRQSSLALCL